ncbi:hypothetical protein BC830DRAFT_1134267 [Chytriomyces sp. MP71]|nr:hypothetical protein BC830DRAFT_1134267 [Chytriomyces sp. MP71]
MRLFNLDTCKVEAFTSASSEHLPRYAVFSYCWPDASSTPASGVKVEPWKTATLRNRRGNPIQFNSEWAIVSCTAEQLNAAIRHTIMTHVVDDSHQCTAASPIQFTHLWMDVLCVNQDSKEDKAREVPHMDVIYANSAVCWAFLDTLGEPSLPVSPQGLPRWFTRLWTLQETILPRNLLLLCKTPHQNKWLGRKHFVTYLWTFNHAIAHYVPRKEESNKVGLQLLALALQNPSVRFAIMLSTARQCYLPHDRFVGIMGIISCVDSRTFDRQKFKVDYDSPVEHTAKSFVGALNSHSLRAFETVAFGTHTFQYDDANPSIASIKSDTSPSSNSNKVQEIASTANLGWFADFSGKSVAVGGVPEHMRRSDILNLTKVEAPALAPTQNSPETANPVALSGDRAVDWHWVPPSEPVIAYDALRGVTVSSTQVVPISSARDKGPSAVKQKSKIVGGAEGAFSDSLESIADLLGCTIEAFQWARDEVLRFREHHTFEWSWESISHAAFAFFNSFAQNLKLEVNYLKEECLEERVVKMMPFYTSFVRVVELRSSCGDIYRGIGSQFAKMSAEEERQLVLVYVGHSVAAGYGVLDEGSQTALYAVCTPVKGQESVFRKIGVFHCKEFDGDKKEGTLVNAVIV